MRRLASAGRTQQGSHPPGVRRPPCPPLRVLQRRSILSMPPLRAACGGVRSSMPPSGGPAAAFDPHHSRANNSNGEPSPSSSPPLRPSRARTEHGRTGGHGPCGGLRPPTRQQGSPSLSSMDLSLEHRRRRTRVGRPLERCRAVARPSDFPPSEGPCDRSAASDATVLDARACAPLVLCMPSTRRGFGWMHRKARSTSSPC